MKKTLLFCAAMMAATSGLFAQVMNYGFSASSGTYTPITGTVATIDELDNGRTGLLPVGFTFVYDGISYTQLGASTNGFVRLGNTIVNISDAANYHNLSLNSDRPILAPLWDNHKLSSLTGMRYETTGTAPNRIFTLQWSDVNWTWINPQPAMDFQLKLYETSNKIEFIYRRLPGDNFGAGGTIGISGAPEESGNYLALNNASASPVVYSTAQFFIGDKPATGQVYSFQPLAGCTGGLTPGTALTNVQTVCSQNVFLLRVSGASEASGLTYQWESSTDGSSWIPMTGEVNTTVYGTQSVSKQYRRATTCGTTTVRSAPVAVNMISQPTITASGNSVCTGSSVTLTSSFNGGNQWYRDGNAVSGAASQTYVATAPGSYTVTAVAFSSCVSSPSNVVTITQGTPPTTPSIIASGATTFCPGGSVVLTSSAASGNQWYLSGNAISGATGTTYTASAGGNYTVVTTAGSCSSAASSATTVTVNPTPATPIVTAGGATSFCQGGSVNLTSSAGAGNQWYQDNTAITGATNATYSASNTGNYTVKATVAGCTSPASTPATVAVNPVPAAPVITLNGNTFTSSAAAGNSWYKDNIVINGATGQTYTATAFGDYTSKVTVNNCTSAASNAINFIPTAISFPELERKMLIAPNPVRSVLEIRFSGSNGLFSVSVSDLSGRTVLVHGKFSSQYRFDMTKYAASTYLVHIRNTRTGEQVRKVIVKE